MSNKSIAVVHTSWFRLIVRCHAQFEAIFNSYIIQIKLLVTVSSLIRLFSPQANEILSFG